MIAYRLAWLQVDAPVGDPDRMIDRLSVSTVPYGADEIHDALWAEETMHAMGGWRTKSVDGYIVAAKLRTSDMVLVTRVIYAVAFDPADDGNPDIELRAAGL